jgi:hypothetical protein
VLIAVSLRRRRVWGLLARDLPDARQ